MNNETTATGIAPEMTIPDAVNIARQEAAKNTGEVRSALTMLADYAMPLIPHDEPAPGDGEKVESAEGEKCGKLVGIACGKNCITAWCIRDGLRITVTAERHDAENECWSLTGRYGEQVRMIATIFGGRWTANVFVRMMRNAMVSRCNRVRRHRENYKTNRATESGAKVESLAPEEELADTIARQKEVA